MSCEFEHVDAAIRALQKGKSIILMDDPTRENEGDLVCAAETVEPDAINFMIRNGSGIVCLAMTSTQADRLQLPLMVPTDENTSLRGTPFTISIDASPYKYEVTTGVSAADRAITVQVAMRDRVEAADLVKPGHIFPLRAHDQGLAARSGHTEGSIDIMRLGRG